MFMKNLTAYGLAVVLFVLSSCKKDFVSDPSSVTGDVVSNNNTYDAQLETAYPVHTPRANCNQFQRCPVYLWKHFPGSCNR